MRLDRVIHWLVWTAFYMNLYNMWLITQQCGRAGQDWGSAVIIICYVTLERSVPDSHAAWPLLSFTQTATPASMLSQLFLFLFLFKSNHQKWFIFFSEILFWDRYKCSLYNTVSMGLLKSLRTHKIGSVNKKSQKLVDLTVLCVQKTRNNKQKATVRKTRNKKVLWKSNQHPIFVRIFFVCHHSPF